LRFPDIKKKGVKMDFGSQQMCSETEYGDDGVTCNDGEAMVCCTTFNTSL